LAATYSLDIELLKRFKKEHYGQFYMARYFLALNVNSFKMVNAMNLWNISARTQDSSYMAFGNFFKERTLPGSHDSRLLKLIFGQFGQV